MDFLILIVSLAVLLYSSDKLVELAVQLARSFKISPIVIGLTIVSIGTSLPEVMTSVVASFQGHTQIAIGNVVGSNICNIALILGLPALFYSIRTSPKVLKVDCGIMLGVSFLLWGVVYMGPISRIIGGIFLFLFALFIFNTLNSEEESEGITEEAIVGNMKIFLGFFTSFILVLLSSKFIVDSAVNVASQIGVSKNVIAISIIAFGTSVPELSVSIAAARKKQLGLLVGNIIGSNISNILLVLGAAAVVSPLHASSVSFTLDIPIMLSVSLLGVLFLSAKNGITPLKGAILLLCYALVVWRCVVLPL